MEERVECAECGTQYDSQENPFCPRCGGLKTAVAEQAVRTDAARHHPGRRRVQAAGVILIALGAVYIPASIAAAVMAESFIDGNVEQFSALEGGTLLVRFTDAGAPVEGANVTAWSLSGEVLANGTTDDAGRVSFRSLDEAGVNATVAHGNSTWERRVFVSAGTTRLSLDTQDAQTSKGWVGVGSLVTALRVIAIFLAALFAVVVAGGVAALRLRPRSLALAGAGGLLVPALVLGVAAPSLLTLPLLVFAVVAMVLIGKGRRFFHH